MSKGGKHSESKAIFATIAIIIALAFSACGLFWLGQYEADYLHRQEENAASRAEDPGTKCYSVFSLPEICITGDKAAKYEAERCRA